MFGVNNQTKYPVTEALFKILIRFFYRRMQSNKLSKFIYTKSTEINLKS